MRKNRCTNLLLDILLPPRLSRPKPLLLLLLLLRGLLLAAALLALSLATPPDNIIAVLNRHALGHVVDLVHAHEAGGKLKHVVAQGDDDKLGVLGALFDVVGHDGHLVVVVQSVYIAERVRMEREMKGWPGLLTFLKSNAASISSMTYSGVGL